MGKSYDFQNTGAVADIAAKYGYTLPDSIPLNNSDARASFFSSLYNNITSLTAMEQNNQFNAEQAQISREWNSEPAVMERRREAGLHMVNPSGGSSGGGSGGGSVPASSVPVPNMSQPSFHTDYAGIMQAGVDIAKAPFDILKTNATAKESLANVEKLNAETGLATAQAGYTKVLTQLKPEEVSSLLSYQASQTEFNEASINQVHAIADYYREQTFKVYLDGLLGIQGNEMDLETRINDIQKNYAGFELDSFKYSKSLEKSILDGSFQYGEHKSNGFGGTSSRHLGTDTVDFYNLGGSGGIKGSQMAGMKSPKIKFDIAPLLSGASATGGYSEGKSTTTYDTLLNTNMTNRVSEFYYQNRDYIDLGKKITGTAFLLQRSYNPRVIQQSLVNLRGLERAWHIYQRARELYRMQRPQSNNFMGE